jgi:hypothetical protein
MMLLSSFARLLMLAALASLPAMARAADTTEATPIRLVLLPPAFAVYSIDLNERQSHPDEASATAAGTALASAAQELFRGRAEIVQTGELTSDERNLLRQHAALFDAEMAAAFAQATNSSDGWHAPFDYRFGTGLSFLSQRVGARLGLMITGQWWWEPKMAHRLNSISNLFAPSGRPRIEPMGHLFGSIVDLQTGQVLWMGVVLAIDRFDVRQDQDARTAVENAFHDYPQGDYVYLGANSLALPGVTGTASGPAGGGASTPKKTPASAWVPITAPAVDSAKAGLAVELPIGWRQLGRLGSQGSLMMTRDGRNLQLMRVIVSSGGGKIYGTKLPLNTGSAPADIAQGYVASFKDESDDVEDVSIAEVKDVMVAGRSGFRVTMTYTSNELHYRAVAYGWVGAKHLYYVDYHAPILSVFDENLDAFEKLIASIRMTEP